MQPLLFLCSNILISKRKVPDVDILLNLYPSAVNELYVCFFNVFRPTREFFNHMETSPLPVN